MTDYKTELMREEIRKKISEMNLEEKAKNIFIVCPVRNANSDEEAYIQLYVAELENQGKKVHYPKRDTNQDDKIGYNICSQNSDSIFESDEIHVFWNPESEGSIFDAGCFFMLYRLAVKHNLVSLKPVRLINKDSIKPTRDKSFTNLLLYLDDLFIKNDSKS